MWHVFLVVFRRMLWPWEWLKSLYYYNFFLKISLKRFYPMRAWNSKHIFLLSFARFQIQGSDLQNNKTTEPKRKWKKIRESEKIYQLNLEGIILLFRCFVNSSPGVSGWVKNHSKCSIKNLNKYMNISFKFQALTAKLEPFILYIFINFCSFSFICIHLHSFPQ